VSPATVPKRLAGQVSLDHYHPSCAAGVIYDLLTAVTPQVNTRDVSLEGGDDEFAAIPDAALQELNANVDVKFGDQIRPCAHADCPPDEYFYQDTDGDDIIAKQEADEDRLHGRINDEPVVGLGWLVRRGSNPAATSRGCA
jgi:hypothetical protein